MILLDALYINSGGGKILLDILIHELYNSKKDVFYLLDKRINGTYDFLSKDKVLYIEPSIYRRHLFYLKNRNFLHKILCFGNIPPSIKLNCPVYTYFQNVLIFDNSEQQNIALYLKHSLKKLYIKFFAKNTSSWLVQSKEVEKLLINNLGISKTRVRIVPFFFEDDKEAIEFKVIKFRFLYVSDGLPYKMHKNLLLAFNSLYKKHKNVSLVLTISSRYHNLINLIDWYRSQGVAIENKGWVDRNELEQLYSKSEFFIYPSSIESFGLGLIEAAQRRMKILAADLPYVHCVIEPSAVFDPFNIDSIYDCMVHAINNNLKRSSLKVKNSVREIVEIF